MGKRYTHNKQLLKETLEDPCARFLEFNSEDRVLLLFTVFLQQFVE